MEQDKEKEKKFWDECAKKRIYAAFDKEEYSAIFDYTLGEVEGKEVIDIGCASGISAILLAFRGARVLGVDISPELIKQADDLLKDNAGIEARFEVGDAENLNVADGSIDAVFFGGVIHHFPDKTKVIEECRRVLKKGGKILAIEPNYDDFFQRLNWRIARRKGLLSKNEDLVKPSELINILQRKGFIDVRSFTFREHLSFLGLLFPKLRKFFAEHGETTPVEKILLFPVDLFRDRIKKGNFLVIYAEKNKNI